MTLADMLAALTRERIAAMTAQAVGEGLRESTIYYLGNPLNGLVTIPLDQSESAGMVWIHGTAGDNAAISGQESARENDDKQFIGRALMNPDKVPDGVAIYGTPVYVKQVRGGYEVDGLAGVQAAEYLYGLKDRLQRSVDVSQIDMGLTRPTSPPSSKVIVTQFPCVLNNVAYFVPALLSSDLIAAYAPVTAGQAVAVKIEVDPATETLHYEAGAAFTNMTHKQAFNTYYPKDIDPARLLSGWVKIYSGMTIIQIEDILHAQSLITGGGGVDMATIAASVLVDRAGDIVTADGEIVWIEV